MKPPTVPPSTDLCGKCVGLCCRYFALAIDKPETRRDFEDIRWYLLHEDTAVFVEEGQWYLQINRKCRALMPDNRCAIYEERPPICRSYKTHNCDWHGDQYEYERVFVDPDDMTAYAREYLSKKRKSRAAARKRRKATAARKARQLKVRKTGPARRPRIAIPLLKSA
ncbi:MAG TPA: YkgJ family cysteine cluster protein [Phycisphaerae bacterium]|nr:YkgJ family cysteine cluster protein [Phycisphaerae bacterium]HRR85725.1 YkgJ family cysteine cluster protein [Phycisphaerae bacterium]